MQFTDTASAGNGGVATLRPMAAQSSPSATSTAVAMRETPLGSVTRRGAMLPRTVALWLTSTDLSVSANGGTAISDASGGNYNLAFVS